MHKALPPTQTNIEPIHKKMKQKKTPKNKKVEILKQIADFLINVSIVQKSKVFQPHQELLRKQLKMEELYAFSFIFLTV